EQLLTEFQSRRSPKAFAQIVERHGGMVLRTCVRVTGSPQDAEEAAQSVFLTLVQRPETVAGSLGAWLHQTALQTAGNLVRTQVRRLRREQVAAQMSARARDNDDQEAQAWREELDAALAQMPERLREAVVLRYLEGRSQAEAARLAACPQGTLGYRA